DPAIKEAQQAEQVAEALALEAQRTWSQAQKATQALRKDRGFGAITGRPQPNDGRCFNCGGPHLQRDCPDLRHRHGLKGKGKMKGFWNEADDYYANFSGFGKSKSKGKSKKGHWMDVQGLWKGKGKGPKGKTKDGYRTVNAYSSEMFLGGLEVIHSLDLAASSTATTSSNAPQLGMLDCGATASAAPEAVVKGLISSVLSIDRGARIDIDQYSQPFFRFGNGKWGKALCRVLISSSSSGRERQFALYTLPNPAEYFQNKLDKASLVPVLIGMDFLGPQGQGMMIDFNTGTVYFDMSASDHVMPTLTAVSSDVMSESVQNMYWTQSYDNPRNISFSIPSRTCRPPEMEEEAPLPLKNITYHELGPASEVEIRDIHDELPNSLGTATATMPSSAEHYAQAALNENDFQFTTLERLLMMLRPRSLMNSSVHHRGTQPGVNSLLFGAFSHGNFRGITRRTMQSPSCVLYINKFLQHHIPDGTWSSFVINFDCQTRLHCDHHNARGSYNHLVGMGAYSGGGLWLQGQPPDGYVAVKRKSEQGYMMTGYVMPTKHRVVTFDPFTLHATQSWTGLRLSISAYTTRLADGLTI
ncbi:unnamed protein product, partial [Symbiodinium necroappetens]